MTDFAQAFQNDHNISDAVNEIGRWLVKLFHLIAQSHMTFWCAWRNSFAKCISISRYLH